MKELLYSTQDYLFSRAEGTLSAWLTAFSVVFAGITAFFAYLSIRQTSKIARIHQHHHFFDKYIIDKVMGEIHDFCEWAREYYPAQILDYQTAVQGGCSAGAAQALSRGIIAETHRRLKSLEQICSIIPARADQDCLRMNLSDERETIEECLLTIPVSLATQAAIPDYQEQLNAFYSGSLGHLLAVEFTGELRN